MEDEFQFSMYFILICTFYDIFVKNYQTFYLKKKAFNVLSATLECSLRKCKAKICYTCIWTLNLSKILFHLLMSLSSMYYFYVNNDHGLDNQNWMLVKNVFLLHYYRNFYNTWNYLSLKRNVVNNVCALSNCMIVECNWAFWDNGRQCYRSECVSTGQQAYSVQRLDKRPAREAQGSISFI